MRSAWIVAAVAGLFVAACGDDDASSAAGSGSGASGGAGGGSSTAGGMGGTGGGSAEVCEPDVSGQATSVTIRFRNTGASELSVGDSVCITKWRIAGPNGATAPRGNFLPACEDTPAACAADCLEEVYQPLPAQGELMFTWDGVAFETLDAKKAGCPAAQAGEFCPGTCERPVDAAPGSYTLTAYAYDGMKPIEKKVTFTYPDETVVEAVFP